MLFQDPNALQVRVTLCDIEPAVWRRLVLPWTWHLGQLHLAIQAAFNWWNCHLHEFEIGGLRYGGPELLEDVAFEHNARVFNESQVRLLDFERGSPVSFTYRYDFGDGWRHAVEFEQLVTLGVAPKLGACIAGARARPSEDVGGIEAYKRFRRILADRSDPEDLEMKQWCGGHFDPEWFDLELANKYVVNAVKPGARRRLHQPRPKT